MKLSENKGEWICPLGTKVKLPYGTTCTTYPECGDELNIDGKFYTLPNTPEISLSKIMEDLNTFMKEHNINHITHEYHTEYDPETLLFTYHFIPRKSLSLGLSKISDE